MNLAIISCMIVSQGRKNCFEMTIHRAEDPKESRQLILTVGPKESIVQKGSFSLIFSS